MSSNGGAPVTRQFSQSTHGARLENGETISQTQQAYSDSHSGMEKIGLERSKGNRARKIVKERMNGQETSRDMLKNIGEDETASFDQDWNQSAMRTGLPTSFGTGMFATKHNNIHHVINLPKCT